METGAKKIKLKRCKNCNEMHEYCYTEHPNDPEYRDLYKHSVRHMKASCPFKFEFFHETAELLQEVYDEAFDRKTKKGPPKVIEVVKTVLNAKDQRARIKAMFVRQYYNELIRLKFSKKEAMELCKKVSFYPDNLNKEGGNHGW